MNVLVAIGFVGILSTIFLVGLWIVRTVNEAEERILTAHERQSQNVLAELGVMQREAFHQAPLLASIDGRVAGTDATLRLLPPALEALRSTVTTSVQELQENILPPEAYQVGKSALTRVAGMRERIRAQEEASLREFEESLKDGAPLAPVRVRPGD